MKKNIFLISLINEKNFPFQKKFLKKNLISVQVCNFDK